MEPDISKTIYTTISAQEWYEFQMGDRDISALTPDGKYILGLYFVGRNDSLRKKKYDGEYYNLTIRPVNNLMDYLSEEAMSAWDVSFTNPFEIYGYTWIIKIEE